MLSIERDQTTTGQEIIRPVGELDAFSVSLFRQALSDVAPGGQVIIDLSRTPSIDSAGLGALLGGIRHAREQEGDVAVVCNRPRLIRLLRTNGFDHIVPIALTVIEAARALALAAPRRQRPPIAVDPLDDDPSI